MILSVTLAQVYYYTVHSGGGGGSLAVAVGVGDIRQVTHALRQITFFLLSLKCFGLLWYRCHPEVFQKLAAF